MGVYSQMRFRAAFCWKAALLPEGRLPSLEFRVTVGPAFVQRGTVFGGDRGGSGQRYGQVCCGSKSARVMLNSSKIHAGIESSKEY